MLKELLRRRVPQILGVYLAVGWGVLEFSDWLINRYVLSPHLVDFSLVAWAAMIPTVLLLAWNHGAPGRDHWTKLERLGIPLNLGVAAALLLGIFGGRDLGAATQTIRLATEAGDTIERVVPKSEFRKSLALFYFDNQSGDTAFDWLGYGIPYALGFDLAQDYFLDLRPPADFLDRLREAGLEQGLRVPLTLKREVADFLHLEHFVGGSIEQGHDSISIKLSLYETRRGKLLQERTYRGVDPFELVDRISVLLKQDLGIPSQHIEESKDLPVAEMLTRSIPAFRAFTDGFSAVQVRRDWRGAAQHYESAVALDPGFARAHLSLFETYTNLNETRKGEAALETAMGLLYKLPERLQFRVKSVYYWLMRQDIEKAQATAAMHAELFPEDVDAHIQLSTFYDMRNRKDDAIAEFERVLELDPGRVEYLRAIGETYAEQGEYRTALDFYRRYTREAPNDPNGFLELGGVHRWLGDHESARGEYEKALVVDPGSVRATIRLADLDRDFGRFEQAVQGYERALRMAVTAEQRAQAFGAYRSYYTLRGQPGRAIEYMHQAWTELRESTSPFSVLQAKLSDLAAYAWAGRADAALDTLTSLANQLEPPFDVMLPFGYTGVYLELEEPDSIEKTLPGLERFIEAFGLEELRSYLLYARGRVFELRGACDQAILAYERAREIQPQSIGLNVELGRCYRKLGQLGKAEIEFKRPLEFAPVSPHARYELALVLVARGERERALEQLRSALEVWQDAEPVYKPAREARDKLAELSGTV